MAEMSTTVTLKGPIFERNLPQLRKATNAMVDQLAQMAEQRLDDVLQPRPKPGVYKTTRQAGGIKYASVGTYRSGVAATVVGNSAVISDGGVEYGPWLEGTSSRNKTTRFKGYHAFRKTKKWLQREANKKAEHFEKKMVKRLGG